MKKSILIFAILFFTQAHVWAATDQPYSVSADRSYAACSGQAPRTPCSYVSAIPSDDGKTTEGACVPLFSNGDEDPSSFYCSQSGQFLNDCLEGFQRNPDGSINTNCPGFNQVYYDKHFAQHNPPGASGGEVGNESAPAGTSAAQKTGASTRATVAFVNPIAFDSVSEVVGALLNNLKGILAAIAIVMIVVGGIMYILSAGDENMIKKAKGTITAAIAGLAIALAAPTFLKEIKKILGGAGGANPDDMVDQALTLQEIVMRTLDLLLSIVGIIAIIGLIVGGAFYLTAYGDEDRIKKGKTIITSSLIGIVVALAALVLVKQIANLLGVY